MSITPRRIGFVIAAVYLAIAIYMVIDDRKHSSGFLPNMATFLVTAPLSFPLSWAGFEPDLRRQWIVGALVAGNTALFYRLASWLAHAFM